MNYRVQPAHQVRPFGGAGPSGDAVYSWSEGARGLFAVVDALGHGEEAGKSAQLALEVLERYRGADLGEVFVQVHTALEGIRGVVMSAIHVDGEKVMFAGVGNVEVIGPPDALRPVCLPGVLGTGRLHLRLAPLRVAKPSRWGLVSDGIRQRDLRAAWLDAAGLGAPDAARRVLERAGRDDDDASVLVLDFEEAAS